MQTKSSSPDAPTDSTVDNKSSLRRPGESAQAFAAADQYFKMRAGRSLEAVARKLNKSKSLLARWSVKYQWGDRAYAYDEWLAQLDRKETERVAKQTAAKWAKRLEDQNEDTFQYANQLLETARNIHKLPLLDHKRVVEKYADGREKLTDAFQAPGLKRADEIHFVEAGLALRDGVLRLAASTETKVEDEYVPTPYVGEKES